jgi:cbb3-type cytochrome oxidase maturation protein
MRILFVLIPISLVLLALAIGAFIWAVRRGQFDDLDTPAIAALADDDLAPRPTPDPPSGG